MSRTAFYGRQFERDAKLMKKRSKKVEKLGNVVDLLIEGNILSEKYYDHKLGGEYTDDRECHIESDWLLIYKIDEGSIFFVRTGTHSDLFE